MARQKREVRHGPPDTTWTFNDALAGTVELTSDGAGVVKLSADPGLLVHERRIADILGLVPDESAEEPEETAPEEPAEAPAEEA